MNKREESMGNSGNTRYEFLGGKRSVRATESISIYRGYKGVGISEATEVGE